MLSAGVFDQMNDNPGTSVQPSWLAEDVNPPSPLPPPLLHAVSSKLALHCSCSQTTIHLTTTWLGASQEQQLKNAHI